MFIVKRMQFQKPAILHLVKDGVVTRLGYGIGECVDVTFSRESITLISDETIHLINGYSFEPLPEDLDWKCISVLS